MHHDNLAEWSKALDLGSSPQGREFKSHSCHPHFPPLPHEVQLFAVSSLLQIQHGLQLTLLLWAATHCPALGCWHCTNIALVHAAG